MFLGRSLTRTVSSSLSTIIKHTRKPTWCLFVVGAASAVLYSQFQSKQSMRYFSYGKRYSPSEVRDLYDPNNTQAAVEAFFKHPNSFDAVFLLNKKNLSFEQCLNIYKAVDTSNKSINLVISMFFTCKRFQQVQMMTDINMDLIERLEACWKRTTAETNDATWNLAIKCLSSVDSEYCSLKAMEWFERIDKFRLARFDHITLGIILNVYAKHWLIDKCMQTIDLMKKVGFVPNAIDYGVFVKALIKSGKGQKALEILEKEMPDTGVQPNVKTFTMALAACYDTDNTFEIGKHIHSLLEASGLKKDFYLNSALVHFYTKYNDVETSRNLLETIISENHDMDINYWNLFIESYAKNGLASETHLLFDKMIGTGMKPTLETFSHILNVCCNSAERIDTALQIYNDMQAKYGMEPTDMQTSQLIQALCSNGKIAEAEKIITLSNSLEKSHWTTLLNACHQEEVNHQVTGEGQQASTEELLLPEQHSHPPMTTVINDQHVDQHPVVDTMRIEVGRELSDSTTDSNLYDALPEITQPQKGLEHVGDDACESAMTTTTPSARTTPATTTTPSKKRGRKSIDRLERAPIDEKITHNELMEKYLLQELISFAQSKGIKYSNLKKHELVANILKYTLSVHTATQPSTSNL